MHWYDKEGKLRYDADMRTARKECLLPSVTTIDKVIANYGLDEYKLQQMFAAAQSVAWEAGESEYSYYKRVKKESKRHARDAAKLGTVVHHLIERYLSGKPLFFKGQREDVWKIFDQAKRWIDENIKEVTGVEIVCVNINLGYAGKADCVAKLHDGREVLIDWKTTDPAGKLKKDGLPKKGRMFYPSHIRQLSALIHTTHIKHAMNVVVSTNQQVPGVWVKECSLGELTKGFSEFKHALSLWYSTNNYEVLDAVS